jgi:hypothetical protein
MTQPVDNESLSGKTFVKLSPKSSPPNVFIGGPVRESPGFPIEAFGNDKILEVRKSKGFPRAHRSELFYG